MLEVDGWWSGTYVILGNNSLSAYEQNFEYIHKHESTRVDSCMCVHVCMHTHKFIYKHTQHHHQPHQGDVFTFGAHDFSGDLFDDISDRQVHVQTHMHVSDAITHAYTHSMRTHARAHTRDALRICRSVLYALYVLYLIVVLVDLPCKVGRP